MNTHHNIDGGSKGPSAPIQTALREPTGGIAVPQPRRDTRTASGREDAPARNKKKRIALLALAAIVALMGLNYIRTGDKPKFRTLQVMRGDLFIGPTATGTVEPVGTVDVGARILGSIQSFGPDRDRLGKVIEPRSRVKEGDVLATLDDAPAKAELEKAKANLDLAKAELERYRARKEQADRDFARAEDLRDVDSPADYENALSERDISKAELAMAEARLAQAEIAYSQAEINLGYTVIKSPVDGVVIQRRVNVGQTVVTGLAAPSLFLLATDLSKMRLHVAVNEADIGDIQPGQKVTFTVDTFRDRVFTGKVSLIQLDASQIQNVVSYPVIVDVDNSDGTLIPYLTAKLRFEVASRRDVLLVPNQALRWQPTWEQITPEAREGLTRPTRESPRTEQQSDQQQEDAEPKVDPGAPTVWIIADDGLVRPVPVKTGLTDGMVTEIADDDLPTGTEVVVNFEREAKPDFVSSFISKVTNTKKK